MAGSCPSPRQAAAELGVRSCRCVSGLVVGPVPSRAVTVADDQGYPEPPAVGDEASTLLGSLERQRETLAWKCADLDLAGLRATVGVSSVTLGGLLKHLAFMEDI